MNFEQLCLVIDHFGVDEASAHADLSLFSQKVFHLAHIVALKSAYRLPRDLRVREELPLDEE